MRLLNKTNLDFITSNKYQLTSKKSLPHQLSSQKKKKINYHPINLIYFPLN